MKDNGLSNVMELIKGQRWENLFKGRELVHIDAVNEFYAKMSVIHLKKKDVVKSSVKGVVIEFDHDKLATILGVPGNNGIYEYIKDVWEESRYTKPLEITRRFANDETLTAARRVKSGELKPFQRFIHFLVMKNVVPRFGKRDTSSFMDLTYMDHLMSRRLVNLPRDGIWWIGSGENRRRDDDDVPEEEEAQEEEGNQADFDWEAVVDEAAVQGESGSGEKSYDAEDEAQGSPEVNEEIPAAVTHASAQQKQKESSGVDPSCPTGRIPEAVMHKFQAEFERARANRFQADLEKAQAENARLLALLQQAQSKPKP
ncbi:hypothetical protein Dimus_008348 [Dionaea muscipula]